MHHIFWSFSGVVTQPRRSLHVAIVLKPKLAIGGPLRDHSAGLQ